MQNRTKIYIWIIVILLATNLATVGSILYHLNSEKKGKETTKMEMPSEKRTRFFRQQLELDTEQLDQFRKFNRTFNRTAKPIVLELEQLRIEMLEELGEEISDSIQLANIASEIGELHTELKETTISFYLNMKTVCSKEQEKKLYEIFHTMLNHEENIKLPRSNHHGERMSE